MGRFMALGLTHSIFTSLEGLHKKKVTREELQQEMQRSLYFDINLYDEAETEKSLVFTLKDRVLETGLIPLLESIYPMVYRKPEEDGYPDVLKRLRETPHTEWMDMTREKRSYAFQMDNYAGPCYVEIQKDFLPEIELGLHCVILYHGYGKIIMEGIGDFTSFLNRCIHGTFKDHPLARAVQVYITS